MVPLHSDEYLSVTACCSQNSWYCCLLKIGFSSKSCPISIRSAPRPQDYWTLFIEISKGSRIEVWISKFSKSVNRSFISASLFVMWFQKYQQCVVIKMGVHFIQPWKIGNLLQRSAQNSGSFAMKPEITDFDFTRLFSLSCSYRLRSLNF